MKHQTNVTEMKPSEYRKMVLKALYQKVITGDEAKALIRDGQKEFGIFLYEDDMTESDFLIQSGLEKMGFFGGLIMEGTGKNF